MELSDLRMSCELFEGLAIAPDKETIADCVRGGLSRQAWFALSQLLGISPVREYDGSWADWSVPEAAPIGGNSIALDNSCMDRFADWASSDCHR